MKVLFPAWTSAKADEAKLNALHDLAVHLPVDELSKDLRKKNEPVVEAVAFQGQGVFETLKDIARQVLTELKAGG